ncbi:hypothetical protein PN498_04880 [Oscillatoria sp. CS-180]|uniref:filament integrity protein FraC n=1 Tax=Oscillatoria sp. CS-180 TaxID=3021720 RepID=UPI00232D7896|nr:filament integrity protein FraC [Oscillatoria sp. CS-180]MDB9525312.1 hypothetical protein [Oscillatoria sp. CS-180]
MPLFIDEAAVLPLKAIVFQCLLLLVAIALEAIVLRRQLRLGFQPSIRYAATINLLTVVLGWVLFLGIEPLLPETVRTQIISYVLFGDFYPNVLSDRMGFVVVLTGLVAFFLTLWTKVTALEWLTWLLDKPIVKPVVEKNTNRFRYRRSSSAPTSSPHVLAVLEANAFSFSAVLVILLLRHGLS